MRPKAGSGRNGVLGGFSVQDLGLDVWVGWVLGRYAGLIEGLGCLGGGGGRVSESQGNQRSFEMYVI